MNPITRPLLAALVAGLCCNAVAVTETRPALLELFTSEGCSSCPPAELIVNELVRRQDVLALTYHVDYWDHLGWRDPYSLPIATQRQRSYSGVLHTSAYTPQAVIDGRQDVVGSHRQAVIEAVSGKREGVGTAVRVHGSQIDVSVGAQAGANPADVLLIGYLRQAITHVGRGENSGRTIQECNIVRSVQRLGAWDGSAREYRASSLSLPHDVSDVAVLVQAHGQGAIMGVAAQPLR